MRAADISSRTSTPEFIQRAQELATYVSGLDQATIARVMNISPTLADKTLTQIREWAHAQGTSAIDSFVGDIYSGLQAQTLNEADRAYANETLKILSGLYGVLRPLDAAAPYRLEMAYRFPDEPYNTLYRYWGDALARALPSGRTIINTSSVEYTKAIFPYLKDARIITPKFLTVSSKTGEPTFVTVHAKIARGAFARWIITNRIEKEAMLKKFSDLGYGYDASLSTETEPVFVAKTFDGFGLSVRLT